LERIYTIPLGRAWIAPRHRRTKRAVELIKKFAIRHMKASEVIISPELNEELWRRGIEKPPRRIVVKMAKDKDGVVRVSLST
ncbi:MAG: 50S ribosomal protein L31e, partial [Nitrososphaerota archaeon]